MSEAGLTRCALLDLFGRHRKRGQQFHYYLDHYFGHDWRWRDLCIDIKSTEEVIYGLEKVDERIIACTNVLGRLSH